MNLVPNGSCSLCDENTSVLGKKAVQPYIAKVGKGFFNADNNNFKQFQNELFSRTICSLCVQKISACTSFKTSYEALHKRNGITKTRSCFVCEKKGLHLINTFDDPNGIIAKFTLFTNYTSTNASYEDCEMCLECLFYINLWCEVHNTLVKKLNIDEQALESFQRTSYTGNFSDNGILKKDKENVTPPHNNIQFSNKKLRSASIEKKPTSSPKSHKKIFKQSREEDRLSRKFSIFLRKKLKNIKCLRDKGFDDLNLSKTVLSDRKMFNEIPYVLISLEDMENKLNSHTKTKRSLRLNKPIETINLSESEDDFVMKTTRVSFQLPAKEMSPHPSKSIQLKITCAICDKYFFSPCDYKSHCLWHEKPEYCHITLVRHELPVYAKASEFDVNKKSVEDKPTLDTNVDTIILKYVDNTESDNLDEINSKSEEKADQVSSNGSEDSTFVCISLVDNSSHPEEKLDSSDNENESLEKLTVENKTSALDVDTDKCDKTEEQIINLEVEGEEESEQQKGADIDHENDQTNNSSENISESDDKSESNVENAVTEVNEDLNDKNEFSDDQEDDLSVICSSDQVEDLGDKSDNLDCDDEATNNVQKRKRSCSPVSDENSDEDIMPKMKKVRFSIDYSYSKCSEEIIRSEVEPINLSNSEEHVSSSTVDDGCNN